MNFPLWIRSQVTVTAPGKLTDAEVLQRITDQLVSKGAIITSVISNSVQFHIERVLLSINPLAACRAGSVAFERVSGAIRISYELDVRYLVGWMGALAFLFVPLILVALFVALLQAFLRFADILSGRMLHNSACE